MQNSSVSTTAASPYVSAPAAKPAATTAATSTGTTSPAGSPPAIDGRDRLEISSLARKLDLLRRADENRQTRGVDGRMGIADDASAAPGQAGAKGRAANEADRTGTPRDAAAYERSMDTVRAGKEAEAAESDRQQTELDRLRRLQEEAQARGEELSVFERERLGRLERIELLVQEGRYSIEPAMMDLLAIRLAKYMISPHA